MGIQNCGELPAAARSTSEVMSIVIARGSPTGMLAEPTVVDQLLFGQLPKAWLLQLPPKGAPVIRSTSGQITLFRRSPGVVWTQSCWFPPGQGGPAGLPQVFRVFMKSGLSGGLNVGLPGPQP